MEELKQHLQAIQKWKDENKENRAAIVLVAEISNEKKDSFEQNNLFGLSGKQRTVVRLLKDALADPKIASLVKRAAGELAIESFIKKVSSNE